MKTGIIWIIKYYQAFILIICFLYAKTCCSQNNNNCSDTFFRKEIILNHDSVSITNFKLTSGNSFLLTGDLSNEGGKGIFGKMNSDGQLVYIKKSFTVNNEKSPLFTFTESGDYLYWAGAYYQNDHGAYVIKTDLEGNIINTFFYSVNDEYSTSDLVIQSIKYINDDEIYVLANAMNANTAGTTSYNLLFKINSNGIVYWSKAFNTGTGSTPTGIGFDIYKKNNDLYIAGTVSKPLGIKNGIFIMLINGENGDILSLRSWSIKNTNLTSNCTYNNCFNFRITEVGKAVILTSGCSFSPSPSEIYYGAVKISLDNGMNVKDGIQVKVINNPDFDIYFADAVINSKGEFCSLFTQQTDYVFCILSNTNILKMQKKIIVPNSWPLGNFANSGLNIDTTGIIYNLSQYNTPSLNDYELVKINSFKTNLNRCLGIDTNFVQKEMLIFEPANFTWDSITQNIVTFSQLNVPTQDITAIQRTICYEAHTCDTLKISTQNNVCLSNPNSELRLTTNPTCTKKIFWDMDSSIVQVQQNINDTLLSVKFLQPFHGYITAGYIGCDLRDSVYVDVTTPKTPVELGPDINFCSSNIVLSAGNGYKTYKWQDGSAAPSYNIKQAGKYWVTVTDSCNNSSSDTINVIAAPDVNLNLTYAGQICNYDSAFINLPSTFNNYTWSPFTQATLTSANQLSLFPSATTVFTVTGKTDYGCSYSDTVKITVIDCPVTFFVPKAFTPDNNNINDVFKPILNGRIEQYEFLVYNRFGDLVFKTKNPGEGWDGRYKNLPQETGTYTWSCRYKFKNDREILKSGSIVLLR